MLTEEISFTSVNREIYRVMIKSVFEESLFDDRSLRRRNDIESVGKYKKGMKDGRCFEYRNRVLMRECVYEKNKMKEVLREWKGDVMIEYDKGMRVYEGGWKGSIEDGFVREGEGKEYDDDGKQLVYSGGFVNGIREGMGRILKNGLVIYDGEMKYGYPNGNGRRMNEDGDVSERGEWKNGYLKDGKVVIDFESGKKRRCGSRWSMRGLDDRFHDWWSSKSKCKRFWFGLLFWIVMIPILLYTFYKLVSHIIMGILIVFFRYDIYGPHNCWEYKNLPIWLRWKLKAIGHYIYYECRYMPLA